MLIFVEGHGRLSQLIKSNKKNRHVKGDDMNVDHKEKKLNKLFEMQTEEIEDLKLMLKESTLKLEEHERDIELLTKLYQKRVIGIDGNPVNRDYDE